MHAQWQVGAQCTCLRSLAVARHVGDARPCRIERRLSPRFPPTNSTSRRPPPSRRLAGVCVVAATRRDPYDVLGVSRGATLKDVKRAYRKKALKLHPDVNKAPDAKEKFMECKQAYQELLEGDGRRAYAGNGRDEASRGRSSSTSRSSSSSRDYDGYGQKRPQEAEDFYGLGDLFRDLENEWQKARPGEPKSLWEELADIGEELVEFLERNLPEESSPGDLRGYADTKRGNARSTAPSASSASSASSPEPPKKKGTSVDDELAELKRRMGL
jgi:curved DNA-binding protein CbpA